MSLILVGGGRLAVISQTHHFIMSEQSYIGIANMYVVYPAYSRIWVHFVLTEPRSLKMGDIAAEFGHLTQADG